MSAVLKDQPRLAKMGVNDLDEVLDVRAAIASGVLTPSVAEALLPERVRVHFVEHASR